MFRKHEEKKCENEQCVAKECPLRHPKKCKFFAMYKNCKFGTFCRFDHDIIEEVKDTEEIDKINLWRIMLQQVAESNEKAWAKAKTPVWSAWERKDRPPSDSTATNNVLFRKGKANYGFRKAKDAMKIAEWIAFNEGNRAWGIVNHSMFLNLNRLFG